MITRSAQPRRSSRAHAVVGPARSVPEPGDVRIVEADLGAALAEARQHVGRGRLAGVGDVRLEGDAQDADPRAARAPASGR